MASKVQGFADFEALASRRFMRNLKLILRRLGQDVEVYRRSSLEPRSEQTLPPVNQDAAAMYQVGSGLGQEQPIANLHERAYGVEGEHRHFTARIVASHHLYAPKDEFNIADFEEVYFFTLDTILPDDDLLFHRQIDNLRRGFRVIDYESVGTTEESAFRLLMSSLQEFPDVSQ